MVSNGLTKLKNKLSQKGLCYPPPPPPVEEDEAPPVCTCYVDPINWEGSVPINQPSHYTFAYLERLEIGTPVDAQPSCTKGHIHIKQNAENGEGYSAEYHNDGIDPYEATGKVVFTFEDDYVCEATFNINFLGGPP